MFQRVAKALAEAERPEERALWSARSFYVMRAGFIPAGRIQSAAGTQLTATLIICFVQPVGDSISHVEDGHPGIYTALTESAETMQRGGGVGYDFSRNRPRGAALGSTQTLASGPVSYQPHNTPPLLLRPESHPPTKSAIRQSIASYPPHLLTLTRARIFFLKERSIRLVGGGLGWVGE